eukprot:TRINITY_DN7243_c0_g1_i4.p1 TRINITY_DN7243_c0_g1~~TRINITY_DN7243_c0_g1_i4.p1  ORF type:complete len:120 (+),score=12.41 TRINITY_DN7243_c0_g1_i4:69-428(+)
MKTSTALIFNKYSPWSLHCTNSRAEHMVSLHRGICQQVHVNTAVYGGTPDLPVNHVHLQQLSDMTSLSATLMLDHLVLVAPDEPHHCCPKHAHAHHCSHQHSRHHSHLTLCVHYGGAEL